MPLYFNQIKETYVIKQTVLSTMPIMFIKQQQFQMRMLKSQKLLEIRHKSTQLRPLYTKPKYKTYIELLGLDKPKKHLYLESDEEDENILQRMIREEKQSKKKKVKNKRQPKAKAICQNHEANQATHQNSETNQLNNPQNLNRHPSVNPKSDHHLIKEGQVRIWKRMQTPRPSIKQVDIKETSQHQKEPIISQECSIPYIVNKALKVQARFGTRSEKGIKTLKELKEDNMASRYNRISLQSLINPESNKLAHSPREKRCSLFKAKILTNEQIRQMAKNTIFRKKIVSPSLDKQCEIFKSEKEERIFLDSLRHCSVNLQKKIRPLK